MKPADVIKLIKDKEVKYADLRFTDTRGKEQHVTIPAKLVDEDLFRDGKMFDGSSISGWKGINESDMILSLDPTTAVVDPFFEQTTVNIRCDVIEPATMQGYERDPRSLGKRAEAISNRPASPMARCSDPKTNSSSSTAFVGPAT
jgi:glutamine synthetase